MRIHAVDLDLDLDLDLFLFRAQKGIVHIMICNKIHNYTEMRYLYWQINVPLGRFRDPGAFLPSFHSARTGSRAVKSKQLLFKTKKKRSANGKIKENKTETNG